MSDQPLATVEDSPVPEVAGSAAIIQVIERAASDPTVDIEKMERLLEMHERILNRNAEQAFNEAMKTAQEEMPSVLRNCANTQTKSRYANLEAVGKAMNSTVTKHGFSMSFGTADSKLDNHYRITCTVSHIGGHSREYHADVPADTKGPQGTQNKTATHGFGSTMSYGRRYLKMMIFDVSLTDDDTDGNAPDDVITETQALDLLAMAEEISLPMEDFLKYLKVDDIANLPARNFNQAVNALKTRKASQ